MTDARISRATSLEELRDALTEIGTECHLGEDDLYDLVDVESLPTFGGEPMVRDEGLLSRDATHVLMGDTPNDAGIVTREEWLKAMAD